MSITNFVSGSALILAGWLGLTFVHESSPREYPSQRRGTTAKEGPALQTDADEQKVGAVADLRN